MGRVSLCYRPMTPEVSTAVGTSEGVQQIIGNVFVMGKKLGSGSFGEIYWCYHNVTHEEYAVKIEPSDCKHPQLMYEAKLLKHLQGGPGISQVAGMMLILAVMYESSS